MADDVGYKPPFTFYRENDGTLSLESAVFQALGAASTCWDNVEGAGLFRDDRAREVGEALVKFIRNDHFQVPEVADDNGDLTLSYGVQISSYGTLDKVPSAVMLELARALHRAFPDKFTITTPEGVTFRYDNKGDDMGNHADHPVAFIPVAEEE